MLAELKIWLLWCVWVLSLNGAGLICYYSVQPKGQPINVQLGLEVSPVELEATAENRTVEIIGRLERPLPVAVFLTCNFEGSELQEGTDFSLVGAQQMVFPIGETTARLKLLIPIPRGESADRRLVIALQTKRRSEDTTLDFDSARVTCLVKAPHAPLAVRLVAESKPDSKAPTRDLELTAHANSKATAEAIVRIHIERRDRREGAMFKLVQEIEARIAAGRENSDNHLYKAAVPQMGESDVEYRVSLLANPQSPGKYRLDETRTTTATFVFNAPPREPPLIVWLHSDRNEIKASDTKRTIEFKAQSEMAPKNDVSLSVQYNGGTISEGRGFRFETDKLLVIKAGQTDSNIVRLIVDVPKPALRDEELKAELLADSNSMMPVYKLHQTKSTTLKAVIGALRPEYTVKLTTKRDRDQESEFELISVTIAPGGPPVDTVRFHVTAPGAELNKDYSLDLNAVGKDTYELKKDQRQFKIRYLMNPELPPPKKLTLDFQPIDQYKFEGTTATKAGAPNQIELSTAASDRDRDLLLLVALTDEFSGNKDWQQKLSTQLNAFMKEQRRRVIGERVYAVSFPNKVLFHASGKTSLHDSWRGLAWEPTTPLPKIKDGFETWNTERQLTELTQSAFHAKEEIAALAKERQGTKPLTTIILWPSEKQPKAYGQRAALFDVNSTLRKRAEEDATYLFWLTNTESPLAATTLKKQLEEVFTPTVRAGAPERLQGLPVSRLNNEMTKCVPKE